MGNTICGIPVEVRDDVPKGHFYLINPKYMKLIPNPELMTVKKRLHGVMTDLPTCGVNCGCQKPCRDGL